MPCQRFSQHHRGPILADVPRGRRLGLHQQGRPERALPRRPRAQAVLLDQPPPPLGLAQRQDRPLVRRLDRRRAPSLGRGPAAQGHRPEFTVTTYADKDEVSFMVIGDPGEGDDSQYQVLRPLKARCAGTDFTSSSVTLCTPRAQRLDYLDQLLLAVQRSPGCRSTRSREPRLVRRPARLHDPLLRRRPDLARRRPRRGMAGSEPRSTSPGASRARRSQARQLAEMRQRWPEPGRSPRPYWTID